MNLLKTTPRLRNRYMALLAFAGLLLLVSSPVCAQYNLAVVPASPIASQPFVVAARTNPCFDFFLNPPGQTETLVSPGLLELKVGALDVIDCSVIPYTVFIPFPGVSEGNYELRLIGTALDAPEYEFLLESIQIVVGPAFVSSAVETIPATETAGNALLILATALVAALWLVQQGR